MERAGARLEILKGSFIAFLAVDAAEQHVASLDVAAPGDGEGQDTFGFLREGELIQSD